MKASEFTDIEVYSNSKLDCFSKCPRKFFNKYVLGKSDASVFFVKGQAVHFGQEWDNREKLAGNVPHIEQVLEAAVCALKEKKTNTGIPVDTDEFVGHHKKQLETYEKLGLRQWVRPVANTIEAPFEFMLNFPDQKPAKIVGFVDVVSWMGEPGKVPGAAERQVVDYKTCQRPYAQSEAEDSYQMELYRMGAQCASARVVSFVAGKRQKPTTKSTDRADSTPERRSRLLYWLQEQIRALRSAMQTGDFARCSHQTFWCGRGICPFYEECYPEERPGLDKLVTVGELKPVGIAEVPDWKR